MTGVAYVALDLGSLDRIAATVPLPEQGVLAMVDREGVVLARTAPIAGRVGEKLPYQNVLKTVLAGRGGRIGAGRR